MALSTKAAMRGNGMKRHFLARTEGIGVGLFMAMKANYWNSGYPSNKDSRIGFRVAGSVPEPGSLLLLICGTIAGYIWLRNRKSS
jgi:hypothetical protein